MFGGFGQTPGDNKPPSATFGFGAATTAPPATNNMLGAAAAPAGNLFGAAPATATFGAPAPSGAGLFGAAATAPKPGGLFGTAAAGTPAPNLFGAPTSNTPASGLFSEAAKPAGTNLFGAAAPKNPAAPANPAPAAPSMFGSAAPPAPNMFGAASTAAPAAPNLFGPTSTAAPAAPNLFGTTANSSATPNLFGAAAPATTPSAAGANGTKPISTAPSMFGAPVQTAPALGNAASNTAPAIAAKTIPSTSATVPPLGPTSQMQLLRNKSVDEILHKWYADLNQSTTDFHKKSIEIQKWDTEILQNGNKITSAYNLLQETENCANEITQNLEYIEAQQSQLEAALGGCQGLVQHDGRRSAADIDRDRAYTLAERLNKQLDAMGSQLESIFDGIAKKPTDNALDTITSILGQHLISLEWLEKQASEMESKLETLGQLESTAKQQAQRIHQ